MVVKWYGYFQSTRSAASFIDYLTNNGALDSESDFLDDPARPGCGGTVATCRYWFGARGIRSRSRSSKLRTSPSYPTMESINQ